MAEDKKNNYNGYTEARKRANEKYLSDTVESFNIRVPKGQKAVIKAHADKQNESMNAFVVRAIKETMQRDSEETPNAETIAAIKELESGRGEHFDGSTSDFLDMIARD